MTRVQWTVEGMGLAMKFTLLLCSFIGVVFLCAATVQAAPALRHQVQQHGDFLMIGNTLGYDCDATVTLDASDTVGNCNNPKADDDTGIDVFWEGGDPNATSSTADATIDAAHARSTAVLAVPAGATVTYARLYWGSISTNTKAGLTADLLAPGSPGVATVTADDSQTTTSDGNDTWYYSSADITSTVQASGSGPYRVGNILAKSPIAVKDVVLYSGWMLIVFYQLATDPPRNLSLFDDFALVANGGLPQTQTISGFLVPDAGFDAKLGVFAFEGDNSLKLGDSLTFNGTVLSDAENPATNFFNGSHSNLGLPVSTPGDLPLLSGLPGTLTGIDLDVVNITDQVKSGDTSATFTASTVDDTYWIGALVTSISTFAPDLSTSAKTFRNLSGGATLRPGDEIEYTIFVINTGNDASVNTVVTDALPQGIDYVADSIRITQSTSGAGVGAITDPTGDDAGEYDSASRTLTVRIGDGATATEGGSLQPQQSVTIVFDARIDLQAPNTIANQAVITASGAKGSPSVPYNTDGNGNDAGAPPTTFTVAPCAGPSDCTPPLICATDLGACVQCTDTEKAACVPTGPGAQCFASNGQCGCTTDADCSTGRHCNTATQLCADGLGGSTSGATTGNNDAFPGLEGGGCRSGSGEGAAAALVVLALWFSRRQRRR